jgi:SOS-response transcriptional repressor LexA
MSAQLTERQESILASIQESLEAMGTHPYTGTWREDRRKIYLAHHLLPGTVEALGYITRDRSISRGIRLTGQGEQIPKSVEVEQGNHCDPLSGLHCSQAAHCRGSALRR